MADRAIKLQTRGEQCDNYDIRYYATELEHQKATSTWGIKFPHVRPDSVLVASIGNKWVPGAWQKVMDMVDFTNRKGICCWFVEIPDLMTTPPYQLINRMRDVACMHAVNMGFEWMLMIENDALPDEDLIIKLLKTELSIILPYVVDPQDDTPITFPKYERNSGIRVVQWSAFTCMLMWTKVFNCFDCCRPFNDIIIEVDFFNKLIHFGHRAYQDTGTEMKIATSPTRHNSPRTLHELERFWEDSWDRLIQPANRKPIDPEDKREVYSK